jgi:hypothetical protein
MPTPPHRARQLSDEYRATLHVHGLASCFETFPAPTLGLSRPALINTTHLFLIGFKAPNLHF